MADKNHRRSGDLVEKLSNHFKKLNKFGSPDPSEAISFFVLDANTVHIRDSSLIAIKIKSHKSATLNRKYKKSVWMLSQRKLMFENIFSMFSTRVKGVFLVRRQRIFSPAICLGR